MLLYCAELLSFTTILATKVALSSAGHCGCVTHPGHRNSLEWSPYCRGARAFERIRSGGCEYLAHHFPSLSCPVRQLQSYYSIIRAYGHSLFALSTDFIVILRTGSLWEYSQCYVVKLLYDSPARRRWYRSVRRITRLMTELGGVRLPCCIEAVVMRVARKCSRFETDRRCERCDSRPAMCA